MNALFRAKRGPEDQEPVGDRESRPDGTEW